MKILAIRGKNLASLEGEFSIDFNVEPLKSAGIFAITGPTGAGKSTILDAMCLALFDNAPRVSKGENIQVNDVLDQTINQTDSRNILRKGAGEGRAEVDFTALSGEVYRAIWSVRRVKNRPDGVLLNTEIKLYNLNRGIEEQGTKTVLLKKINGLIGLNFNQFIRAVLLAQGDFATFLKARQSDKAELLEKLTGTDIYSKISTTIHLKTKEVNDELNNMQKQRNSIELLTDREIADVHDEKSRIDRELEPVRDILSNIDRKLNWIRQYEELSKETEAAAEELKKAKLDIETAKPRYAYIEILDASFEIRETYIELNRELEQLRKSKSGLAGKESQLEEYEKQILKFDAKLQKIKGSMEQTEQDFAALKPLIARSRELDVKIQAAKEKLAEADKELKLKNSQKHESEKGILNINTNLDETKRQADIMDKWFREKESYRDIVRQVDLILATLEDVRTIGEQISTASKSLQENSAGLISQKEILEQLEKESEQLNRLLPAEILNLRRKLKEGEPCPVCGSVHHPVKTTVSQDAEVNEEELEKKKRKTADSIDKTNRTIESIKENISRLDTGIRNDNMRYESLINRIEKPLQAVDNWKNFISNGVLKERLSNFAILWKKNEEKLTENLRQAELYAGNLSAENAALAGIVAECQYRETLYRDALSSFETLVNEQATLLGGKKAGEMESSYNSAVKKLSAEYGKLNSSKFEIDSKKSEITGVISQMKKDIEVSSTKITGLNAVVEKWLSDSRYRISGEELKDLMSKSYAWITGEKKELAGLKDRETKFSATHRERAARLERHSESSCRPDSAETAQSLAQLSEDTAAREKELKQRQTAIDVALAKHRDNRTFAESLDTELKMKTASCEEWKKLDSLLGSHDGRKFKNIIQSYTMDILLEYANKHLETLSRRYRLEKAGDLALQVIDNDMLGEIRSIHSLSGGESFLISLALALGLSALSSNRMQIESLFIDEGFGSLDADTLNIAIDALENLYTQGRKIGIISHVGEMRIPVQIKVIKSANGKSVIQIVNN
ncbi:MAG: AAA family ATPase [Prevotellaceae bacterium]|jgi:exonuclease SbcC|nr:AAA family ATPase [Prevotellaceae bacterium]